MLNRPEPNFTAHLVHMARRFKSLKASHGKRLRGRSGHQPIAFTDDQIEEATASEFPPQPYASISEVFDRA